MDIQQSSADRLGKSRLPVYDLQVGFASGRSKACLLLAKTVLERRDNQPFLGLCPAHPSVRPGLCRDFSQNPTHKDMNGRFERFGRDGRTLEAGLAS